MSRKVQSKGVFRYCSNHRNQLELRPSNRHKLPLYLAGKRPTKRRSVINSCILTIINIVKNKVFNKLFLTFGYLLISVVSIYAQSLNSVFKTDSLHKVLYENKTYGSCLSSINYKDYSIFLYGSGATFIEDTYLLIKQNGIDLYSISVPEGYDPYIGKYKFNEKDLLFYSSQTGGSGGYGNYILLDINENNYEILFNSNEKRNNTSISASFVDDGKMIIDDLIIDVNYMDKSFYGMIFDEHNLVKTKVEININPISTVFICYNSALKTNFLLTFRSITAIAEVNRLGYVTQSLYFDGHEFIPYITDFSILIKNI